MFQVREDPSVDVSFNEETGQLLVSGMGELHLEIGARDQGKREANERSKGGSGRGAESESDLWIAVLVCSACLPAMPRARARVCVCVCVCGRIIFFVLANKLMYSFIVAPSPPLTAFCGNFFFFQSTTDW